jgi:hypothetical protein
MSKSQEQVRRELIKRGLVSVMNDTKWAELREAVRSEMPFGPPYQLKDVLNPVPEPEDFESDVDYWGDWSDECLVPFYAIEWLRIRPRFLRRRGGLVAPVVQSVEAEFLDILRRYHIPHRCDGDAIWIYGYTSNTNGLVTNR